MQQPIATQGASGQEVPPIVDASRKTRAFLSYSRADETLVVELAAALEAAGDIEVLRDKNDILPAEEWRTRLEALIIAADAVIFCLSPSCLGSRETLWELTTAERLSKRIIPVVVRPLAQPAPVSVARLNYIFMTEPATWDDGLQKIRSAIQTDIGWIREHTRIGELSQRWMTNGQRRDDLLRGPALDAAEAWLAAQPPLTPGPAPEQRAFILAGRQGATRRQRYWVAGSLSVAAVAVTLSLLAFWQRGIAVAETTDATARRLSAEAQLTLADPLAASDIAVRNLLVSLALSPSAAAREALEAGVRRLPPRSLGALPWPPDAEGPQALAFSPDGAWLGTVTKTEALFWDVAAKQLALRYKLPAGEHMANVAYVPGTPYVLVTLRTPGEAGNQAAWVVVDLAAKDGKVLHSDDTLDAMVVGSTIVAMRKPEGGARAVEVVDLISGGKIATVRLPDGFGPVNLGRLFHADAASSASMQAMWPTPGQAIPSPPARAMSPTAGSVAAAPLMVLLADSRGSALVADPGRGAEAKPLPLPDGAVLLGIDGGRGLLAIRRPGAADAVLSLPEGKQVWEAADRTVQFHGFAAGGRFIRVTDAGGARLESLAGGGQVRVEGSRRTDWDFGAVGDIERYTPIVAAEVIGASGRIVTAWKDGRIAVWQSGWRPRPGGFGVIPMPSFDAIARFDHGAELGSSVGWAEPPTLFVSVSGRRIASQSLGIRTNTAGGLKAIDPLLRIWDTERQTEIARLRPNAPMIVVFSPDDRTMVSLTAVTASGNTRKVSLRLGLWDLSEAGPVVVESRDVANIPLTSRAGGAEPGGQQTESFPVPAGEVFPIGGLPLSGGRRPQTALPRPGPWRRPNPRGSASRHC